LVDSKICLTFVSTKTNKMKINIIEVPTPETKSFTVFADPDLNLLKETKTIRVDPYKISKTRISTSIQFGSYCCNVNLPMEGFKTVEKNEWNMFSGVKTQKNYFIVSKTQNLERYKEYLKQIISKVIKDFFHLELDELTIELESENFLR
jgi:hypothetical protein